MASGYALPGGLGSGLGTLDSFGKNYFELTPEAAYTDWLAELGLTGSDPVSKYARGRYDTYYNLYQANLARNTLNRSEDPNLFWTSFMRNFNPQTEWMGQSSSQRGVRNTPRLRWLGPVV